MKSVGLRILPEAISRQEWNDIAVTFRDHNFYQSWEWGEARRGAGWKVRRFVVEEGGLIVAAAQGLVRQLPLLPWEFLRVRGGPLVEGPHGDRGTALQRTLDGIRQEFRGALVRVSPNHLTGNGIEAALQASGFARPETQRLPETFWVDLEPDLEVLRKRLSSSWRHNLGRAERRGVTVRPIASLQDLPTFF